MVTYDDQHTVEQWERACGYSLRHSQRRRARREWRHPRLVVVTVGLMGTGAAVALERLL